MNYRNDLDECMTYSNYFLNLSNFRIFLNELPNLLSHFDSLLGRKVPKLLESHDTQMVST